MEKNREHASRMLAAQIRIYALKAIASFGTGHVGGSMSIADLLGVLYGGAMNLRPEEPRWEGRDYLVCSKGHAGPAVYGALAAAGFFPAEMLETLNRLDSRLPSHCDRKRTPGVDMTAGSLGQGLSVAAGIALGMKFQRRPNRVYCIVGDGESQEGQVWEALMFAAHNRLDNLTLFVDQNGEQVDGRVEQVNGLGNFRERLESFCWNALEIDGHDPGAIWDAVDRAKGCAGRPTAVVLRTQKGKGCSFAQGIYNHSMKVGPDEARAAIERLERERREMEA